MRYWSGNAFVLSTGDGSLQESNRPMRRSCETRRQLLQHARVQVGPKGEVCIQRPNFLGTWTEVAKEAEGGVGQ